MGYLIKELICAVYATQKQFAFIIRSVHLLLFYPPLIRSHEVKTPASLINSRVFCDHIHCLFGHRRPGEQSVNWFEELIRSLIWKKTN